jgi:Uma2 family endonuclease
MQAAASWCLLDFRHSRSFLYKGILRHYGRHVSKMLLERPRRRVATSVREQRISFGGASWQDYKTMQAFVEKRGGARVSYLDGLLEVMTLSLEHESRKSNLSRLLELYLDHLEIEFFCHGSATLEKELKSAGKEPDESYCFHEQKKNPDLVIEVAITRGGIDTLELYRRWQIPEVWVWQKNRLHVFVFADESYHAATVSHWFPKLDLELLEACARMESTSEARRKFRDGLK